MKKNIEVELEKLIELINDENIPSKLQGVLLKQVDVIKRRVKSRRPAKERGQNINSGLQKPVAVSEEMAQFAGWDPKSLHSRVEVTKTICAYIKENNLQNPENRRIILLNDPLKKLLRFNDETITYPHIQMYIGVHFMAEKKEEVKKENEPKEE